MSDFKNKKNSAVITSRCSGLLKRSARKKSDNSKVLANNVNKKDVPFYCPEYLSGT